MRQTLSHLLGWAVAIAVGLPAFAHATSYAGLEERPATGGELRFAEPGDYTDDDGNPQLAFPLKLTRVRAAVSGVMAEVEVEQVFENPFDDPIEAVYVFPLSTGAAVNAYEIRIGERTVEGVIRTRAEARRVYEEARDSGRTAGLLEQDQRNVFVQSIANIAPRETISVRFRYVERLSYEHATGYSFTYPLTITPRYLGPGETPSSRQPPQVEPTVSGARVDIEVAIDAGMPIRLVESFTHQIAITDEETKARVVLDEGDRIPNKDFVLRYRLAGEQTLATVLSHRDAALGGYFGLMVQPKLTFREGDVTPREMVLLLDVSGSMQGEPLARSKAVAEMLLDSLTPRDRLNVVTFASRSVRWSDTARSASAGAVDDARRFVRGLAASGGTELDQGLRAALRTQPPEGMVRMVYIFTDGGVGDDEAAIDLVRDPEGHNRLFPVGVGAAPNRHLIERLAEEGRGFPTWLDLWEPAADVGGRLVQKTQWPYLTDLTVEFTGLDVEDAGPFRVPDVYAGMPLVVTGRYDGGGEGVALVRGWRAGERVGFEIPVTLPEAAENRPVAYAWVKDQIDALLARPDAQSNPDVQAAITELGLKFAVVTPYTSFVAVDDGRTVEGDSRRVDQPNETPAGYGGSAGGSGGSGSSSGGSWGGGSDDDSYGAGDLGWLGGLWLLALAAVRRRA